jgi:NADPH-dependent 2,4-dienoyl-CoA reductase/sulfur reductase-like enzyme
MSKDKLVIIGGDAAGMTAATKVRREAPLREIIVFERSPHTSYSACGIPYFIAGMFSEPDKLVVRSPEVFKEKHRIDARILQEVVEADFAGKRVRVKNLRDQSMYWEPYDQLLIATGAIPVCPELPGSGVNGIFGLSTLASGIRVNDFIRERKPQKTIIVGGGYIGLEMAEALVTRGLEVTLVDSSQQVMGTLDPDMGALVSEALREVGVTLYLEEKLVAFENDGKTVTGIQTNKRHLPANLVILGMGSKPNTSLAGSAGIELGVKGAIRVNEFMQTNVDQVWAAGDCAESFHLVSKTQVHIALGTIANKQGLVAGTNISGGRLAFPGVVGTAVSKICKYEVARTGLLEKELRQLGIEYDTATIEGKTRAGYFPDAGIITVKLLAEKSTRRLLGAQIVGVEGAAKRIDVMATAITNGLTVQNIIDLDLSYAPPFSGVWDPVQVAARKF